MNNNQRYQDFTKQFTLTNCPDDTPIKCPNQDKSVSDQIECLNDPDCPDITSPFRCTVNDIPSFVTSRAECDCSQGMMKCGYPNVCVKDILECSYYYQLKCSTRYPLSPVYCKDGICRKSETQVPNQRVCPIGGVLCPDFSCRKDYADCTRTTDCENPSYIKCPDQTCVSDQKYCPSTISCVKPNMYVCPEGRCVTSEVYCNPMSECGEEKPYLCPNNVCSINKESCSQSIACGHEKALCSDNICRDNCI